MTRATSPPINPRRNICQREAFEALAWPWTVNQAGKSFYLKSKQEAIAKVKELQAQGHTNIDVGCMQINLAYHPDAFENALELA